MELFDMLEADLALGEAVKRGDITQAKRERMMVRMTEWKEISGGPGSYWDKEQPIEGVLVEVLEHQGQFDKPVYVVKTDDGNVGINASTVLESKMSHVPVGYLVRVTSLGEAKSEKTGRTYQDFRVEVGGMAMTEVPSSVSSFTPPKPDEAAIEIGEEPIPF